MSWGSSQQSNACSRPRSCEDVATHTQSGAVSTTYLCTQQNLSFLSLSDKLEVFYSLNSVIYGKGSAC